MTTSQTTSRNSFWRQFFVTILRYLVIIFNPWMWSQTNRKFVEAVNKLPGPATVPVIGNAHIFLGKNLTEIFWLFQNIMREYGNVVRFWVSSDAHIFISSGRHVEPILQNMANHTKGGIYLYLYDWLGEGLLTASGEKWHVHRKVLTPAFHFNILQDFLPIFNKHALKVTQCLALETKKVQCRKGFDIFYYTTRCSLDIICESAMGCQLNIQDNKNTPYIEAINGIAKIIARRYLNPFLRSDIIFNCTSLKRKLDKHLQILSDFDNRVINERRQYVANNGLLENIEQSYSKGNRKSMAFLDLLLVAEAQGSKFMTPKDIRDQVATFMFEGYDTVATATAWALFMIGTHPKIQDRVVEELEEVFGDSGRAPDSSDLANLKYLERCMKEVARLYPTVPYLERDAIQDIKTGEYVIPAGSRIMINNFGIQRDPEVWTNPDIFDPDRFLPENSQGRFPYSYLHFSAGPRNCIGQRFAQMEEKVVLSTILRRFKVEAAQSLEEVDLQVSLVLQTVNGLWVRLHERDSHPKLRVF